MRSGLGDRVGVCSAVTENVQDVLHDLVIVVVGKLCSHALEPLVTELFFQRRERVCHCLEFAGRGRCSCGFDLSSRSSVARTDPKPCRARGRCCDPILGPPSERTSRRVRRLGRTGLRAPRLSLRHLAPLGITADARPEASSRPSFWGQRVLGYLGRFESSSGPVGNLGSDPPHDIEGKGCTELKCGPRQAQWPTESRQAFRTPQRLHRTGQPASITT